MLIVRVTLLLISITLGFSLFAQDTQGNGQVNVVDKCGQFEALNKMQSEDPTRFSALSTVKSGVSARYKCINAEVRNHPYYSSSISCITQ